MAVRRYRSIGGLFAWRIPVAAGMLLALAAVSADWGALIFITALALAATSVERGATLEVAPAGLSRELRVGRALVRPPTVIAWPRVDEIATRWRRPNDYSALETIVAGDGTTVRFTSRMGYRAYHALIADVAARAPAARRTGLTDQVLREPPSAPAFGVRTVGIAAITLIVLVTWALVA